MGTLLVVLGFLAVGGIVMWLQIAGQKAVRRNVVNRKGYRQGPTVAKSRTTFIVPGSSAAQVASTVITTLDYPTENTSVAGGMTLLAKTETEASFALGNRFGQTWVSTLSVTDEADGAHGTYSLTSWKASDGVPLGWKEMEIVSRRVGEIVSSIGGAVKVRVSG